MARLRQALLGVLESLPGGTVRRPTDLQRLLGIGPTAAWHIYQVATAPTVLATGSLVPGPRPMQRFLAAASQRGVPREVVKAVSDAYRAFGELVATHAGDRRSFDSLISAYSGTQVDPVLLQHKRAAFRAASHFRGVQSKTSLRCTICNEGRPPGAALDLINLYGHVRLRRFHHETPLIVDTKYPEPADSGRRREPLVASEELVQGIPLLRHFSSEPLPPFRQRVEPSGELTTEMMPVGVGNESAVTYFLAYVERNFPSPYLGDEPGVRTVSGIQIPTELIINDVLFPRERYRFIHWKAEVFAHRPTVTSSGQPAESDRLLVQESVIHAGSAPAALRTPEIPRYAEMLRFVCERAGWDSEAFDVYRCRVQYPIVGSLLRLTFNLQK